MLSSLFSLKNKIVVITGAAGLLGRQHADAVASVGGNPVLLDLQLNPVLELAKSLNEKYGVAASGWAVDITDEEAIRINSGKVSEQYGRIDCLVNNAANNPKVEVGLDKKFSRLENFPIGDWNADITVGLTGSYLCAKYYGYLISQNPEGGSIVNISSDLGLIAPDQRLYRKEGLKENEQPVKPVTYSVVKAGLIGLTRYLATYWAEKNVRCNAICPGGVENNQDKLFLERIIDKIPLGRMAQPDEYQGLLVFLLSSASSYINGAIISADGGRSTW
ncbi:oxidoreductase [Leptospira perolatii]|uniref:Oxidoreductase n=1 Tax=Leptospira perolatii TaxID=2023191 RepID=A0A2M9ZL89_9LEPT|nr:SDR family oxidoreductase [Leptospira perolatii]PJZ70280.1 oxidoreductase [Leptospira perolatii]PJZ72836.1 oxidoreductase [Leptospira perolatii]